MTASHAPGIWILDTADPTADHPPVHTFHVKYPDHWFAPVRLSRYAWTIEEETISWMDSLGLIPSTRVRDHIRAMEPRHYAGYSHSMAAYDHALMYSKYITMWLLWDDDRVEVATDEGQISAPLLALRGSPVPDQDAHDPYVAAFRHLGDEYERLGASRAWRERFADKMHEWALHAIAEETVRRSTSTEQADRGFDEALRLRAVTVGIRPNSVPLERAVGIEVPSEIYTDDSYLELIDCAARVCCIVNDLVGVAKDMDNDQPLSNLVLYYQLCNHSTLTDAYAAVLGIHDESVARYDDLAEQLLDKMDPVLRERMSTFFDHLRYMDSGFGFWHQNAVRYQKLTAVEHGRQIRIAIGSAEPESTTQ